ncbi:Non-SMC element 4 [Carabus blaptoides fortunei]
MSQLKKQSTKTTEQRKLEYRDLLDRAETLQENEDNDFEASVAVDEILMKANELFKDSNVKDRIRNTYEVLLDARVIATSSDILLNVTEGIDCTVEAYDLDQFARRIRSKILLRESDDREENSEEEYNWSNLFPVVRKTVKYPPTFSCFYGPLGNSAVETTPPKERKVRVVNKKLDQGPRKEPEKITKVDTEEGSVDDIVKYVIHALNKEYEESGGEPVDYFKFVIDPTDFSTTVENMFHASFLVRDGRAKIISDDHGNLSLIPTSSAEIKKTKKEAVNYKQNILSLDVKTWKEAVKKYNIKENYLQKWKRK